MEYYAEHPDEFAWASFVEGTAADLVRERLSLHMDFCAECTHLVTSLMELRALYDLGRLESRADSMLATQRRVAAMASRGGLPLRRTWRADFVARPPTTPGPGSHAGILYTVGAAQAPSRGEVLFDPARDAVASCPSDAAIFVDGERLILSCPRHGNGVAQVTWLGQTVDVEVGADGRASVPVASFAEGADGGGAMANRRAAWRAEPGQRLTVQFFSNNPAADVMPDHEGATRHAETGGPADGHPEPNDQTHLPDSLDCSHDHLHGSTSHVQPLTPPDVHYTNPHEADHHSSPDHETHRDNAPGPPDEHGHR